VNRDKLAAAVAEAERFIRRAKSLPKPVRVEHPHMRDGFYVADNFPREQGAIRRASMDLTRALADLRRPN
jgi:hypothetical protein